MSALSFTRRTDGTFAINETCDSSQTSLDAAILIGLCLTFWRIGGSKAAPSLLIKHLEQMAKTDPSAECVLNMVVRRNRPLAGGHRPAEPVQTTDAENALLARVIYSEGNSHD